MRSERAFYSAAIIGWALNVHPRTVIRRARRGRWPLQHNGNRFLFCPPRSMRGECAKLDRIIRDSRATYAPTATEGLRSDRITPARRAEATRLARRVAAVLTLVAALDDGDGREAALVRVARDTRCKCSARSLRRWFSLLEKNGVAGLIEHKRGRVPRKQEDKS